MDRVSGWYKRRAQITILIVGFFVAITVNVDTITVAKRLSTDKALRESMVNAADAYAKASTEPSKSPEPEPTPTSTPSPSNPATITPAAKTTPTPIPECVEARFSKECNEAKLKQACEDPNSPNCKYLTNQQQLMELGLPIGWDDKSDPKRNFTGWTWAGDRGGWWDQLLWHWLGWLLTALAISLGAPFWFDLLNKFIVIRSAVKPHEKSPEESSKD